MLQGLLKESEENLAGKMDSFPPNLFPTAITHHQAKLSAVYLSGRGINGLHTSNSVKVAEDLCKHYFIIAYLPEYLKVFNNRVSTLFV